MATLFYLCQEEDKNAQKHRKNKINFECDNKDRVKKSIQDQIR